MSHQYGPAWQPRPPARSNTAWSVVWALVPLLTCGVGTPFVIGHAARRLRSPLLALAAALYGLGIGTFVITSGIYGSSDLTPVWLEAVQMIGLFGSWLGGLGHALILRGEVFRQQPLQEFRPGPPPEYGRPPYQTGPTVASVQHPPQRHPEPPRHGGYPQAQHRQRDDRPPQYAQSQFTQSQFPQGPPTHAVQGQNHQSSQHTPAPQGWLGPYRLIGSLGKGGQGTVHLALTPQGQKVAIKVLHEHFNGNQAVRERFLREVEATRRVATFSTARVLDVNINEDQAYVVSEYVEGVSLEQLVRDKGPRDEDGLTRLALATAGALAAIHRAGVVHRDFKPANVLIGADGPRVIDFGIARALDQATATSSNIMGTPAYMSPEQLAGETVGPETDVFSWASTMIFAASGRVAFGEDTIPAILNRVINHQPDLTALPQSLRPLAAACLDKQPRNRPTASDIMLRIVQ
ncbi:serine/threonine-protein kinase [Streptosporangium amethystogenes]|uniref:serine/threonine-protein kinase n=1 Tax=Streptosporangium amethystogenes TaxID=2002 RepID=UPI000A078FD3|nr:serine/threonine-protein kinase [Streptosporangium amethystogenes]